MNFPKLQIIRLRKYLDLAKGQSCIKCGKNDGSIVSAHYTGIRQHLFGKGKGIKLHDICTAHLCRTCHEYFDQPKLRKSVELSEEFLFYCQMTLIRNINQGNIKA